MRVRSVRATKPANNGRKGFARDYYFSVEGLTW